MRIPLPLSLLPLCLLALGTIACVDNESPAATRGENATDVAAALAAETTPTLAAPRRFGVCPKPTDIPRWTGAGLLVREMPSQLNALTRVPKPGLPTFDPSTSAWYASANGALVRIEEDGLRVVADGIQGIDVDVRADVGLAVSREPNNTIVLHRFAEGVTEHDVLMSGPGFFHPRFSPSGRSLVVSESRSDVGRFWLVEPGATRDAPPRSRELSQGTSPSWHPNGRFLVFARVRDDGAALKSSELWMMNTGSGEERMIGSLSLPGLNPRVSPDGNWIAFMNGVTREALVARFDNPFAGEEK